MELFYWLPLVASKAAKAREAQYNTSVSLFFQAIGFSFVPTVLGTKLSFIGSTLFTVTLWDQHASSRQGKDRESTIGKHLNVHIHDD